MTVKTDEIESTNTDNQTAGSTTTTTATTSTTSTTEAQEPASSKRDDDNSTNDAPKQDRDNQDKQASSSSIETPSVTSPTSPTTTNNAQSITTNTTTTTTDTSDEIVPVNNNNNTTTNTETSSALDSLAAMFPDLDRETIEDVLNSQGGDADKSAALLLEMTGQAPSQAKNEQQSESERARAAQEAADEAFARQLMAETQREEQFLRQQQQSQHHQEQDQFQSLNYVPRQRRNTGPPRNYVHDDPNHPESAANDNKGKDELDQMMEQMKLAAEAGKQTALTWFNKAKAKAQEYQQNLAKENEANEHNPNSFGTPSIGTTTGRPNNNSSHYTDDYDIPAAGYYNDAQPASHSEILSPKPQYATNPSYDPTVQMQRGGSSSSGKSSSRSNLRKNLEESANRATMESEPKSQPQPQSSQSELESEKGKQQNQNSALPDTSPKPTSSSGTPPSNYTKSPENGKRLSLYDNKKSGGDGQSSPNVEYVKNPFEEDD